MKEIKKITISNPSPELINYLKENEKRRKEILKDMLDRYNRGEFDKYFK